MHDMTGKVAIITGGASGIGAATARLFIEQKMSVLIADIQETAGAKLAADLGPHAEFCRVDVSRESEMSSVVKRAEERHGRLDVMFNNAGFYGSLRPILEQGVDDFDRLLAVNLRGTFLGIKHAARVMKAQGSGCIINTASAAGLRAGYAGHLYSATKAAIVQLTTSTAMELGESGVRVNCICPGGILTPIVAEALDVPTGANGHLERLSPILAQMQPIRRAGRPEDIAQAALYLASDAASFINGHALVVDGGLIGGRQWSTSQQQRQLARTALAGSVMQAAS
jgi:NAD(P)-dependent dehydrogenase (short-subunit alcohol dehydrogenase family)